MNKTKQLIELGKKIEKINMAIFLDNKDTAKTLTIDLVKYASEHFEILNPEGPKELKECLEETDFNPELINKIIHLIEGLVYVRMC